MSEFQYCVFNGPQVDLTHSRPVQNHINHMFCFLKNHFNIVLSNNFRSGKGEMEVARRRGRRRKKLQDDLKDRRGYCHLKEEGLDCTVWRHRFEGGFGPVVRQDTK